MFLKVQDCTSVLGTIWIAYMFSGSKYKATLPVDVCYNHGELAGNNIHSFIHSYMNLW